MAADRLELRRLPYPFGQTITFSSDTDGQAPWHGRSIHEYLNETLGLPISDSFWVATSTGGADVSSIFTSTTGLAHQPSGVGDHSVFGLLVREWHRGNFDHFHTWTDDNIAQFRFMLPEPLQLSPTGTASIQIPPAEWMQSFRKVGQRGSVGYRQLRIVFEGNFPPDASVALTFSNGQRMVVAGVTLAKRISPGNQARGIAPSVTIFTKESWPVGLAADENSDLTEVQISSVSCAATCNTSVLGVEIDSFSRWSVETQAPAVEFLNLRPLLLSSHGGLTYHASFAGEGPSYQYSLSLGTIGADLYRKQTAGLAGVSGSHAYYADLLSRLGVRTLTSISSGDPSELSPWNGVAPTPVPIYDKFYAASKTWGDFKDLTDSPTDVVSSLAQVEPLISDIDISRFLCSETGYCRGGAQGSTAGGLIHISRHLARRGLSLENHWYTHFGTSRFDPRFNASSWQPFPASTMDEFRNLALDYYDPGKRLPLMLRAWVPPSGVWSNYRIMRELLRDQITSGAAPSDVQISSVVDPVTGGRLPDLSAGTRDLHGLTVYVPDASAATARVDGKRIDWFTRNAADDSGRASITVIDDSAPTVIFRRLDPATGGTVASRGGRHEWVSATPQGNVSDAPLSFMRIVSDEPAATVIYAPKDLQVWNATHLGLRYKISRADGTAPMGQLALTFVTTDGAKITIAEGSAAVPPQGADTGFWLPTTQRGIWSTVAVAQHDFLWRQGAENRRTLPLIMGRIKSVEIGMTNAMPGDVLEVADFQMFRPSANAAAPDGQMLVGGQVISERGAPMDAIPLRVTLEDGREALTSSDRNGYFFARAPRGSVVSIRAEAAGRACAPLRGKRVEIWRNEAELDIDFARC